MTEHNDRMTDTGDFGDPPARLSPRIPAPSP